VIQPDPTRRPAYDRAYAAMLAMHGHRRALDAITTGA
jgi:hypothetical protein